MKNFLLQWMKSNRVLLINSGSLVGTTAITSSLGFAFWWVAARQFPPEAVGIASALISAMLLLGTISMSGFGTLLITELPRQSGKEAPLISTSLVVVGVVATSVGVLFAVFAPATSVAFKSLNASAIDVMIFAAGVSFSAIALVVDQALVGILRGSLQMWRNACFAGSKLLLLLVMSMCFAQKTGIAIYGTWTIGIAFSLFVLICIAAGAKGRSPKDLLPQWGVLRKLGAAAIQHHFLNLALQVPTFVLPVLVTILLSARVNAWFYVSWMVVSFVFVMLTALTTVLHAMNSAQRSSLRERARVTLSVAFVVSLAANCLLQPGAKQVLDLFGSAYAEQASWCLRILALAAFPLIIKNHFISFCRIQDRIARATLAMIPGTITELTAVVLGARLGGLQGLSLGWVIALLLETVLMFPTVYKTVFGAVWQTGNSSSVVDLEALRRMEEIWQADTMSMAAIIPTYYTTIDPVIAALERQKTASLLPVHPDRKNRRYSRLRLRPVRLERYGPSHEPAHPVGAALFVPGEHEHLQRNSTIANEPGNRSHYADQRS